jgi:casein kinase II subunit alpha
MKKIYNNNNNNQINKQYYENYMLNTNNNDYSNSNNSSDILEYEKKTNYFFYPKNYPLYPDDEIINFYKKFLRMDINEFNFDEIGETIKEGSHSNIYYLDNSKKEIIKIINYSKKEKILKEAFFHFYLNKNWIIEYIPNISNIVFDKKNNLYGIILPYINSIPTTEIIKIMTPIDRKIFMYKMLKILHTIHTCGIIHRDIKPQNIIIEKDTNRIYLIDFGISDFYQFGTKMTFKAGTKSYKAPELLLNLETYNYGVDIWSLGCIFLESIFRKPSIFYDETDDKIISRQINILGYNSYHFYLDKININLGKYRDISKLDIEKFIGSINIYDKTINENEIDLLEKMLDPNPERRITASSALKHIYFSDIKKDKSLLNNFLESTTSKENYEKYSIWKKNNIK